MAEETPRTDLHEANRLSWNAATVAHNSHKGDQAAYLREGGSTLFPEEVELLGPLEGLSLLHLQCNAGQDTLSLAALGAKVTGVDISDEAIGFAMRLAAESGIPARFERADVYAWLERSAQEGRQFDRVFCSYGAICWLSDLGTWARGIAGALAPGGRFVAVDFHPVMGMFDWEWNVKYPYSTAGEPHTWEDGIDDYVAYSEGLVPWGFEQGMTDFENPHPVHEFMWGMGEIVTALLQAGLRLETLREWSYANGWQGADRMREAEGRRYYPPEDVPAMPLMYGIVACRD